MSIGRRVKQARKSAGLTQSDLAKVVGIKQSTISELERGDSRSTSYIALIARACGVSAEHLEGITENDLVPQGYSAAGDMPRITRSVPQISSIQASRWMENGVTREIQEAKHWPCPVACGPDTFAMRVEGVSMTPDFPPGMIIFVDPSVPAGTGKKVVAFLKDENTTTFKQYFEDAGEKFLKAMNKDWPAQYTKIGDNCRIIGAVVFAGFET